VTDDLACSTPKPLGKNDQVVTRCINPAALHALKEALVLAFWYKNDLRAFLTSALGRGEPIAHLDWMDYKRGIVAQLVDSLAADQHRHLDELLTLTLATTDITDPSHLKRVEDGERKYAEALVALKTLRELVEPYRQLRSEEDEANRRREADLIKAEMQRAVGEKLAELRTSFYEMSTPPVRSRRTDEAFLAVSPSIPSLSAATEQRRGFPVT
jgi:hypothetical protein